MRRLRRLHELQERSPGQLIASQEGERQRISKEMHDSLGQDLGIIRKVVRARQERAADLEQRHSSAPPDRGRGGAARRAR